MQCELLVMFFFCCNNNFEHVEFFLKSVAKTNQRLGRGRRAVKKRITLMKARMPKNRHLTNLSKEAKDKDGAQEEAMTHHLVAQPGNVLGK